MLLVNQQAKGSYSRLGFLPLKDGMWAFNIDLKELKEVELREESLTNLLSEVELEEEVERWLGSLTPFAMCHQNSTTF